MKRTAPLVALFATLAFAPAAQAHPEACTTGKAGGTLFSFMASETPFAGPGDDDSAFCFSQAQVDRFDDSGADLAPGQQASTKNVNLLANLPKSGVMAGESNFNSDLAFWGKYAFQGNYNGFQITDISSPENPRIVSQTNCPGAQNDISVWKNLLFLSTDARRTDASCNSKPFTGTLGQDYWEGIKVFDWSDPSAPKLVSAVETNCGSHTHTIVPQVDRVIVYSSAYDLNRNAKDCQLLNPDGTAAQQNAANKNQHDTIGIIEVPLANPSAARLLEERKLFPDGGNDGLTPGKTPRQTRGCHDITVYPAIKRAAGACMGEGVIMDISDPTKPTVISSVTDPNFAFWHSATFFPDGSQVLFTDELGGGGSPTCNPSLRSNQGADAIFSLANEKAPTLTSYYKIPRTQSNTENCVAHNGNFIPTDKGLTYVQAWYQGGTSFVSLDDPSKPREVGFFDRGPLDANRLILGGSWSSYFYNGFVYSNDIQRGLDVMKFTDSRSAGASANKVPYLNAQVQEPYAKYRSASAKKASKKKAVKRTAKRRATRS